MKFKPCRGIGEVQGLKEILEAIKAITAINLSASLRLEIIVDISVGRETYCQNQCTTSNIELLRHLLRC